MCVNDLYQEIATNIHKCIPEAWDNAVLDIEAADGTMEFNGNYCSVAAPETLKNLEVNYNTFKLFKKLRKVTTENQKNNWNRAKFTLLSDGEFTIEFKWDQELADEIEKLANED